MSWEASNAKDPMTDKPTPKAVGQTNLPDGTTIQATAVCHQTGVIFTFSTYHDQQPVDLAGERQIHIRVRFDENATRTADAEHSRANEARALVFDPDTVKATLEKSTKDDYGGQLGQLGNTIAGGMIKETIEKLGESALGSTNLVARANSVRIELVLADGRAEIFDLNPQDQTLKAFLKQCPGGVLQNASSSASPVTFAYDWANPSNPLPSGPKTVALIKPLKVYLSFDGKKSDILTGNITVYGQHKHDGLFVCVVGGTNAKNRTVKALVGNPYVADAVSPEQRLICNVPGGYNVSAGYMPSPELTFPLSQLASVQNGKSITVYLASDTPSAVSVAGDILILGQRKFSEGNSCIVQWEKDGNAYTGRVEISVLDAALEISQQKSCLMPAGTTGGVNLSAAQEKCFVAYTHYSEGGAKDGEGSIDVQQAQDTGRTANELTEIAVPDGRNMTVWVAKDALTAARKACSS